MKRFAPLSIFVLTIFIGQTVSAATLQPTLKTSTPTLKLDTSDNLSITTTEEEEEDTNIILTPEIKLEPEIEIVEIQPEEEEESEPLEIMPIEVKTEPQLELKVEAEPKAKSTLEMMEAEPSLEITEAKPEMELVTSEDEEDEGTEPEEIEVFIEPIELVKEAEKVSNITAEVTEEEDGKLKYELNTVSNFPIYKSESTGTEEIIQVEPKEKIKFSPGKSMFEVEDEEEYDYSKLIAKEEDFSMGFDFHEKEDDDDFVPHLTATPKDDCMEVTMNGNSENSVEICTDFSLKDNALHVISSEENEEEEFVLPALDIYYDKLRAEFEEQKADISDLRIINDESGPHYEVTIEEKHKIAWIIPVSIEAKVSLGIEDNKFQEIKYGLSGLIFKDRSYISQIQVLPDLEIVDYEIKPKTLHAGDEATIVVTVKNTGLKWSYAGYTSEDGPGYIALYFGQNQALKIDEDDSGFFLDPGETERHFFKWNYVVCEAPVNVFVDNKNRIEESDENNNIWNGTVRCLPNDAPDLTVTSMTYAGGTMKVGQTNTINYTIKNQGSQPAPESHAFFEWDDGYFHVLNMPALDPGETHSGSHNFIPNSCSGASIRLDSSDYILESDEDNNIGHDPDTHCTRRPDLFVNFVWWKANGITAGDIHAGEPLWFQVDVENDPITYVTDAACINSFTGVVKLNGNPIKVLNFGNIGCIPERSNNHTDFWHEKAEFTYTPQCNGEHLTVQIDPTNAVLESLENNNSWTFDIVCTAPNIISTPTSG